jgi:hypothetical protein
LVGRYFRSLLAQERLESNKKHASRRTIEPSILQGLVHCRECGYALYRSSTRSSARKISYYRCLGTDAWRYDGHAKCEQRPIRLDLLEHIVWSEIVRLLEDPALIQTELNRRLETARNSSPTKRQQDSVTQDLAQVQKRMDRLLTAYQEDLLSLNELRRRMPAMRQRELHLQDELRSLSALLVDQAAYLRLAETLTVFLERLRSHAETLDVQDRQRITRLLVKEVVVADDSIIIRHSIPTAARSAGGSGGPSRPLGSSQSPHADQSYLLRPWREVGALLASARGEQTDGAPEAELRELGWLLARSLITPENLRLYRAIVAEAERLPELGQVFYENGAKVVRAFAAKILRKRFDKSTAALRAATFVQLVLGDAYLELSIGYTVPNVETRFALQIDEAVAAALR